MMTEAELEVLGESEREVWAMHEAFVALAAWPDSGDYDPDDVIEQITPLLRHVYTDISPETRVGSLLAFFAAYMRGSPLYDDPTKLSKFDTPTKL